MVQCSLEVQYGAMVRYGGAVVRYVVRYMVRYVVRYGEAVVLRYGTMVRYVGTVVLVLRYGIRWYGIRWYGIRWYGMVVWWIGSRARWPGEAAQ